MLCLLRLQHLTLIALLPLTAPLPPSWPVPKQGFLAAHCLEQTHHFTSKQNTDLAKKKNLLSVIYLCLHCLTYNTAHLSAKMEKRIAFLEISPTAQVPRALKLI